MSALTLVGVVTDGRVLCKEITTEGIGEVGNLPYHTAFETLEFKDTDELFEILDELRARTDLCVVRAEPIPGHPVPCRRLLTADDITGDAATLREVPRDWLLLDFDSVEAPGMYFDREPAKAAAYMRDLLPPEFRGVKAVWRASSNAGLKPGIRVHLWMRVSVPLLGEQLKVWLKDAPIDRTPFRAVQPHFTADPIFNGVPDPMAARIGLLDGAEVVQVPDAIVNYAPPAAVALPISNVDPLMRSALTKWAAANAPRLAEYAPGSSTRYPCPVCGSSDGLAVRADGRFNCHGNKHDAPPHDSIGTNTGNVYVGHPVEFLERIPRGTLRKWLTDRFPECFTFGSGLAEKLRAANAQAAAERLTESLSSIVEGGTLGGAGERPSVRELERAALELKKAAAVVKGNPSLLAEVAAQMGRYIPLFLAHKQVHETLLDAAVESDTDIVTRPDAEQAIAQGLSVGREQPHVPRPRMHPGLSYDEQGGLQVCYANVLALVSETAGDAIVWDERSLRATALKPPVWREEDARPFPRALDDADYSLCAAYLAGDMYRYPHATPAAVATALDTVATGTLWDPVREYLDGLQWTESLNDARELLGSIWIAWAGAEDTPYARAVSMRWMIAAVQRTYEPGCPQREVLTLIGPQNIGKSRMLRALCPSPELFSDTCDADGSKDSREVLLGTFIVELGEVDKHIKEERTGAFKNFISTTHDRFRRAYARAAGDYPRRNLFAATTNVETPFKDRTGNTRFNVLRVTHGDPAAVAAARDELWAAAVALYRAGEKSWLQESEREAAVAAQREAYAETSTEVLLRELWECPAPVAKNAATRWGRAQDSPLGFLWEPAQVDTDGCFGFLTTAQMMAYLAKRGMKPTNWTMQAIGDVCVNMELERTQTSKIESLGRARGYSKKGFFGE